MEIYEEFIIIPIDTYGGAGPISSGVLRAHGASGLLVTLYAKTAGTSTLAVRLMLKEIFENNFSAVNADATVTTASRYLWLFNPAGAKQPAGEGAATTTTLVKQFVGLAVPDWFRIDVAKGDTSDWVFGVSGRRIY